MLSAVAEFHDMRCGRIYRIVRLGNTGGPFARTLNHRAAFLGQAEKVRKHVSSIDERWPQKPAMIL
jgi:hypothetical protein